MAGGAQRKSDEEDMFGFQKKSEEAVPRPEASAASSQEELASRARSRKDGKRLNLVGQAHLIKSIEAAARASVTTHLLGIDEEVLNRIATSTREELVRQLRAGSKAVRGMPKTAFLREVQEEKRQIEEQREQARRDLEGLLSQLGERQQQNKLIEDELVAESLIAGAQQDHDLVQRVSDLFGDAEGDEALAGIQDQVTRLLLSTMQTERDKLVDAQMADHRSEINNFERRIVKLTQSLELTEDELKRIAQSKGIEHGVSSIYREVQGLSEEDAAFETKKELMSSIFQSNIQLRESMAGAK